MSVAVNKLRSLPGFMRKLKWPVAAALMDKWFAGPASTDRNAQTPDTTDVTVDWSITSADVAPIYAKYLREKVWLAPPAQLEIIAKLRERRLNAVLTPTPFGNLNLPATLLNKNYITSKQFKSSPLSDELNDVYGALGSFNYHYAIEGMVSPPRAGETRLEIRKVGIFVFDKYDFEDDPGKWMSQPLGFWNFDTGAVSKTPWLGYHEVSNSTFREWRAKNNRGGDFWVYSDVKVITQKPVDILMVKL